MNRNILGKAVRRAVELSERVGDRLKEFVSTEEVPYSYGLGGISENKPSYPSLYLSRSTDASLMKMPGEGSAMVKYRIKRREIDESREDGQPLYGASIEIQSLDPVADETGLESSVFLKEFGMKPRSTAALMKTSKRNPLKIAKDGFGEFKVHPKGSPKINKGTYFTPDIKDARNTAADLLKRKRAGQNVGFEDAVFLKEFGSAGFKRLVRVRKGLLNQRGNQILEGLQSGALKLPGSTPAMVKGKVKLDRNEVKLKHRYYDGANRRIKKEGGFVPRWDPRAGGRKNFAEARDRDGEGRFASGNIPGPQDYAIAAMAAQKKRKAVGVMPGGAALTRGR
jgi:hypothetical protein